MSAAVSNAMIGIVLGERPTSLIEGVSHALNARGATISLLRPPYCDSSASTPRVLLLRAKDPVSVGWAEAREREGAVVVPSPRVVRRVKDRIAVRKLLHDLDITVPPGIHGLASALIHEDLSGFVPGIVKHRFTHHTPLVCSTTVELLRDELSCRGSEEVLIELWLQGIHATAYFIGDEVFVFSKLALGDEDTETEELSPIPTFLIKWIHSFRKATGLHLGKLDVVLDGERGVVVDCGVFPRFTSIEHSAERIAEALLGAARSGLGASASSV